MHRGIGRAFQVASCFPTMTVMENLMAAVTAHVGQWGNFSRRFPPPGVRERAEEVMELVGLTQRRGRDMTAHSSAPRSLRKGRRRPFKCSLRPRAEISL